jgi:uncharacterized cupredoxin-like copper-binding protein
VTSGLPAPLAAALILAALTPALSHEETHFDAGAPGDTKQPARAVRVIMGESSGRMNFIPDHLDVRKGEQIRFVLENKGALAHEFRIATVKDNDDHAAMMRQMPDMQHLEANAITLDPGKTGEMLWRFSEAGIFEFACLIPVTAKPVCTARSR